MQCNRFGRTDLDVSGIGFGAWGIGGPAMAGDVAIGWGEVDDDESVRALEEALDQGVNFIDTADFYGLGHSEEIVGRVVGNRSDVVVATKVGHRLGENGRPTRDYSKRHILEACDKSLVRLRRNAIDYYQLHSPRVVDFEDGGCVQAMEQLVQEGKVRYWGASLNTFDPFPEADYMMAYGLGSGMQLVHNIINQRASGLIARAGEAGYGIIARMPLQFGLLTGKFRRDDRFARTDHRHFRLTPEVLSRALDDLEPVWDIAAKYPVSRTQFSLSFVLSTPGVSTVIPGIKTPRQAVQNTTGLVQISEEDMQELRRLYDERLDDLLDFMHQTESR